MGASCARPVPEIEKKEQEVISHNASNQKEEKKNMILVGKTAPSFKAPAFFRGDFTQINLEDYRGQWVMLCFYPGDFTFV